MRWLLRKIATGSTSPEQTDAALQACSAPTWARRRPGAGDQQPRRTTCAPTPTPSCHGATPPGPTPRPAATRSRGPGGSLRRPRLPGPGAGREPPAQRPPAHRHHADGRRPTSTGRCPGDPDKLLDGAWDCAPAVLAAYTDDTDRGRRHRRLLRPRPALVASPALGGRARRAARLAPDPAPAWRPPDGRPPNSCTNLIRDDVAAAMDEPDQLAAHDRLLSADRRHRLRRRLRGGPRRPQGRRPGLDRLHQRAAGGDGSHHSRRHRRTGRAHRAGVGHGGGQRRRLLLGPQGRRSAGSPGSTTGCATPTSRCTTSPSAPGSSSPSTAGRCATRASRSGRRRSG